MILKHIDMCSYEERPHCVKNDHVRLTALLLKEYPCANMCRT